MKAADLMTTSVATIRPDASIAEAIRLMLQKRISGLPVVDAAGALVGIVTEGDFLRRDETGAPTNTSARIRVKSRTSCRATWRPSPTIRQSTPPALSLCRLRHAPRATPRPILMNFETDS
jgi:CBS-domain-containing membrane protein